MHGTVKMALELWNAMTFHHFNLSPMVVCAKRSGTISCFSCNWVVIFVNRKKKVNREPKSQSLLLAMTTAAAAAAAAAPSSIYMMMMRMRWWWRGGSSGSSSKKKSPPPRRRRRRHLCILIVEFRNIWKVYLFYIKHENCRVYLVFESAEKQLKNESGQKCGKTTFNCVKVFYRFLFILFLKKKKEDQIR